MMRLLGQMVSMVLIWIYGFFVSGYTISVLWGWFIVSKFNLPELLPHEAYGMSLVIGYIVPTPLSDKQKTFENILLNSFFVSTAKALLCLGFGKLVVMYYY